MEVTSGNDALRELLKQAGLTHEATARAVNRVAAEHGEVLRANKSSISHWLKGIQPQPRTVAYLCEALSRRLGRRIHPLEIGYGGTPDDLNRLPDDPVMALASLGRADVDRRQMLTSAVYSLGALLLPISYKREAAERAEHAANGGAIGWAEVDAVRDITAAFNRADEKLGGGFGRTAVVEYLTTDVATYCTASSTDASIRSAMFAEAAQLAYLAGWKAHDLGKEGLAQRYYLHSYQLADESGDDGQAAYVMRILAHQAYDMGHSANCIDLASAAVAKTKGKVDKHTEAIFALTLAKAFAMQGNKRATLETISRAEALMAQSKDDDERPGWAMMHGASASQFHNHVAKVLIDLKDYAGAEEHFSTTLRYHLDPDVKPRIYALATAWLAEAICQRGHVERACQTWSDALQRMEGIQSSRTAEAVQTMRQRLSPFRKRGMGEVRRLLAMTQAQV